MNLAIVGAGYVGIVTAACLAHLGLDVTCLDIDAERVERLQRGQLPVHEPGLDDKVNSGLEAGHLRFTSDRNSLHDRDLVIVCVGTLDADDEWTGATVQRVVEGLAADKEAPRQIVIRSTLMPGTGVRLAAAVAKIDPSVRIAHNPEFTREATAVSDFLEPDRVVIGVDGHDDGASGTALADALRSVYQALEAPVFVTDLTSAETIKLASNVFLAAKITFANELARLAAATGADANAVVDGMGLDRRISRNFLTPGPGFGGSCFPSQARALPELARSYGVSTPIMDAIWPSNMAQGEWLLDGLEHAAGRSIAGMRVALLGLTFKAGTDDLRESPALRLGELLMGRGAAVCAYDPTATAAGVERLSNIARPDGSAVSAASDAANACADADAVVVATEWPQFAQLDWNSIAPTMSGRVVVDGRGIVDTEAASAAGLRVVSLGVESGTGAGASSAA
jgi:UDPglucose 6-dehydrogenase